MKRAYADIPEGQIHYRFEGTGEPILLLHSALASSNEFTKVMPFLSNAYCAIAPDYMGNGDSDPAPFQFQIIDHARTMISFMDCLGIKNAIVVGEHTGGKVGLEMTVTWPERVNRLVLSSIGYYQDEAGKKVKDPPNFRDKVEIKPDGSHLMMWWKRAGIWGHPLDIVEDRFLEYLKAGPRGEEIHWAAYTYDPGPKLPLVRCSTLVLSATHDPFYVVAERVHQLVPESKFTIIENGNIEICRLMPKEFAKAILDFLNASNK